MSYDFDEDLVLLHSRAYRVFNFIDLYMLHFEHTVTACVVQDIIHLLWVIFVSQLTRKTTSMLSGYHISCVLVCSLMTDQTNLRSKLSVTNRASQF